MKKCLLMFVVALLAALLWAEEPSPRPAPPVQQNSPEMKFRMEKRDAFGLIGLEQPDFMLSGNLMELWEKFMKLEHEIPNSVNKTQYGISYATDKYEPKTMKGYNYLVGLEVSTLEKIPDGMAAHKVPAALYAVFDHHGPVEAIGQSYGYIYGDWMKTSGYKLMDSDTFELYGERFDNPDDPVVEIWVPIKK